MPFIVSKSTHRPLNRPFLPARSPDRRPPHRISCKMISGDPRNAVPTIGTVSISYPELKDRSGNLSEKIEKGFGPDGLGIISVSDIPGFSRLRQNLLQLSPRLASLPDDIKKELEDPDSRYNFGWSHGKEKLESGKPDTFKGSFYANPILDIPTTDASLLQRYPSYCRPNKWPTTAIPELEVGFKALGKLMLDVGIMLAYHCDRYVSNEIAVHKDEGLEQILKHSRCHKGRLLYYFPRQQSEAVNDMQSMSSWCGWHTDHGSLTGLTCGMFTRNAVKIPCPDSAAGLYIKARNNQIVKAPKGEKAFNVERSTFALFMQPDWDENLNIPQDIHHPHEIIPTNGMLTFGEYSEKVLNKYYNQIF